MLVNLPKLGPVPTDSNKQRSTVHNNIAIYSGESIQFRVKLTMPLNSHLEFSSLDISGINIRNSQFNPEIPKMQSGFASDIQPQQIEITNSNTQNLNNINTKINTFITFRL